MPPDALTPAWWPATPRRRVMSSAVAPPVEKPVLVLRKSAPAERASSEARSFSSKVSRQVSRMTLTMAPGAVGDLDDAMDVLADGLVVAGLAGFEQAYVEDHIDVVRAVLDHVGGLFALGDGECGAEGEADDDSDGDTGAGECGGSQWYPCGVDHGAGEAVLGGLMTDLEHLGAGGVGLEQGVIEDGGEILRGGESMSGEGGGVEVLWAVGGGIGDGQRVQLNAPSAGEVFAPGYFLSYWG